MVKLVTIAGQLVIARLLVPADFGLVALAYSVTTFTSVLQKNGLRDILVQRGTNFDHYANAAFWMSLVTGLVVALLTIAAAPLAASIYDQPSLVGLLAILALSAPLQALQSVPGAHLQNQMRFKALSAVTVIEGLGTTILAVFFAFLGFGAYSIVLPFPIVQTLSLVWMWRMAGVRPGKTLDLPLWRDLFGASGLLLGAAALYAFNVQGANIVLGLVRDVATVGIFFFGYNLSNQLCGFLTTNLWSVLLPSLSKLQHEPQRQLQAFLRVTRAVNLVGMFFCFALAIIADPALRFLYGQRWLAAIPVLQILSIGMAFNISFSLSINLMMAQGRYRTLFLFNFWRALGFIVLVVIGGLIGGAIAVSIATSLFLILYGPISTHLAISSIGGTWSEVWEVHSRPLIIAVVSCGSAYASVHFLLPIRTPVLELLALVAFSGVFFAVLTWSFVPQAWRDLRERTQEMLSLKRQDGPPIR